MNLNTVDLIEFVAIGILIIVLFIGMVWLSLRIDAIEDRLKGVPTHADLHSIEQRLSDVAGGLHSLDERTAATKVMLVSIHEHLLNGSKA